MATPLVWPLPPEQPRYLYEATLRNAASLQAGTEQFDLRQVLTGEDWRRSKFGKPMGVAVRKGLVYVTDTEGRSVFVFDIPRRRTFAFGHRMEGELKKPMGIAVDDAGNVYVVDTTARRVIVYDALGLYLRDIGPGPDWVRPTAVAVAGDGGRIYVVDTAGVESNRHCVWVYDGEGKSVGAIGRRGNAPGEFNLPADATVDSSGNLWVLDAGNFRVQTFDAQGRFRHMFGSVGNGLGQFARPRGLAVDAQGAIYVCDAAFCNVQVFQSDGTLLLAFGARADSDRPGRYGLPGKLATDETGRIYIVDQFLRKIEIVRRLSDEEGQRMMQPAAG